MDEKPWCWQWLTCLRNFSLYTECEVSWPRLHIPPLLYILSQLNPFHIIHYFRINASVSQVIRVNSVRISRLSFSCCTCQPSHTTCYTAVLVGVVQGGVPTLSSSICRFLQSDVCCFNPDPQFVQTAWKLPLLCKIVSFVCRFSDIFAECSSPCYHS